MKGTQLTVGPVYSDTPSNRNCWNFNGVNQFISGPSNGAFAFGTGSFSIECWVKFNTVGITNIAFAQGDVSTTSSTGRWWFGAVGNGSAITTLWMGQHGGSNISGGVAWTPTIGVWYHVAVCRNGTTNTMFFVNGIQLGATQSIAANYSQNGVAFGMLTTPVYFNGSLSDMRITNNALYTANFGVPYARLPFTTSLLVLTLQDSTLLDNSGLGATYTNSNAVTTSAAQGPPGTVFTTIRDPYRFSNAVLMHAEAADGTIVFTDSTRQQAVNRVSTAVSISTTQSRFGSSSMLSTGVSGNGYLQVSSSTANSMGAGDFTYEYWMRPDSTSNTSLNIPMSNFVSAFTTNCWGFYYNRAGNTKTMAIFCYNANNATPVMESAGGLITDNAWNHIALVRAGATLTLWINGASAATFSIGATSWDGSAATSLYLFGGSTDGTNPYPFKGYIDELRVSKVARYQSVFTPAAGDYDTVASIYSAPIAYAVLNSADKNANITLSNGNLTAVSASNSYDSVRSAIGKSTGKWYFEFTHNLMTGNWYTAQCGLAQIGVSLGQDMASAGGLAFAMRTYDSAYGFNAANAVTSPIFNGPTVGIAVDLDARTLKIYGTNGNIVTLNTMPSGTLYPIVTTGNSAGITVNFGASAFSRTVPAGYNPGWY